MSSKKNQGLPVTTAPIQEVKAIRLKPSATDYATFARTTADAMGRTAPDVSESKPNMRMLSLGNLES